MFEVRALQDLARISIRHVLTEAPPPRVLPRRRLLVGGQASVRPRPAPPQQQLARAVLANRYTFVSRLLPEPLDRGQAYSAGEEVEEVEVEEEEEEEEEKEEEVEEQQQQIDCRVSERLSPDDEEEEQEEEEERREAGALLQESSVNRLREQILGLPLPEPLKMYLLHYREQ
ncbi:hypothetical protein NHX12_012382 [Muraenolepis orangiensis]|uniref:Uncharacterized protein n=1 Tax=Muraenolepis orangiensis TaxID=630683 RepID=A0A9Q0DBU0_9TELE|nr:hypothetical protein NHX12_012382 [Muraenolepis orangiensis]